jgi:SHS2 domain-containing protein
MDDPDGFREVEHTADWELEVWAVDLPGLLEQAARGMYALMNSHLEDGPRISRDLELSAPDRESLLVAFLEELRYLGEVEGIGFDTFDIQPAGDRLAARLQGAPIKYQSKEIKAVTYHNLAVAKTERGLRANIVFDV